MTVPGAGGYVLGAVQRAGWVVPTVILVATPHAARHSAPRTALGTPHGTRHEAPSTRHPYFLSCSITALACAASGDVGSAAITFSSALMVASLSPLFNCTSAS